MASVVQDVAQRALPVRNDHDGCEGEPGTKRQSGLDAGEDEHPIHGDVERGTPGSEVQKGEVCAALASQLRVQHSKVGKDFRMINCSADSFPAVLARARSRRDGKVLEPANSIGLQKVSGRQAQ